jgi:hypothetical protein
MMSAGVGAAFLSFETHASVGQQFANHPVGIRLAWFGARRREMSSIGAVATQTSVASKLKAFVSYSRKDATFAEELVSGLELCGFEAYLDKEDIAPGEPWEDRLGRLIRDADTVVFVLSPSAVASKHCQWEIAETVRLSKRMLPIVCQVVPDDLVPEQLKRLNYIFFTEGRSFTKSLGELADALRIDLEWIRQHTRFAEFAENWEDRGKPASLLLLDGEIDDAKAWLIKRSKNAPQITIQQQTFIDASIRAAEEAQKRDAALQWRAKAWTIAAAVIFAIGAAVAGVAWWQEKKTVDKLQAANLRLDRKIALRVAPSGHAGYFVKPNWYQIASDYSGAIAIVASGDWQSQGTGFIVRGSALYKPWGDEPVFVTAFHVIGSEKSAFRGILPDEAHATFPGLREKDHPIMFGAILWQRPIKTQGGNAQGVTVLRIKGALPFGARPIEKVRNQEFENLPQLDPNSTSATIEVTTSRPLAIIGFGGMNAGFALFLNNLVGVLESDPDGKPLRLAYTYVTEPGASGSPVFDIETGDLVAIHELGRPEHRIGAGTSIVSVIAAIRKDLGTPK